MDSLKITQKESVYIQGETCVIFKIVGKSKGIFRDLGIFHFRENIWNFELHESISDALE